MFGHRFNVMLISEVALAELPLPVARPEQAGLDSHKLAALDQLMADSLNHKDFPGAVILVVRQGKIVWRKAYGQSQLVPSAEPMKIDMLFDLASVTKPVATATAVMILVEQGKLRLWDKVRTYISEFVPYLKEGGVPGEEARLFHLLTHTSGLPPYTDPEEVAAKYGDPCTTEDLVKHIAGLRKELPPGQEFVYSCLNYITLARIIKLVSGDNLADFPEKYLSTSWNEGYYVQPAGGINTQMCANRGH